MTRTVERVFVENTWYAAAWEWEVAEADNKLGRTICERPIIIYRKEDGGYVALDNRCCHRGAPLTLGRIEGNCIRCMYHGLLFNERGEVIQIPGQDSVASSFRVRQYAVSVKGGMIWIWIGDPARADDSEIHDFAPLSQKDQWRGFDRGDYLHYDANWLLIVDNLSDFSHVAFVHANTLGGSEAYAYDTRIEGLDKLDNGFQVDRWHRNSGPPPFHRKVIPALEHDVPLDRLNRMAMYLPGVFLMETYFTPVAGSEDKAQARQYRNCQFMTPETRNSTHFFWDYLHEASIGDPSITESLKQSLLEGFLEDKIFIEEQQKLLEKSPDFVPRSFSADEAFQHFRNLWRMRLKQEDEADPIQVRDNPRRIL